MSTTTETASNYNGTILNDLVYHQPIKQEVNCKYRLPCGWCDKKNCLCTYNPNVTITPLNDFHNKDIKDYTTPTPIPLKINPKEFEGTLVDIPPSCVNCPNHPSNGGSGLCHCILGQSPITCTTVDGKKITAHVSEIGNSTDNVALAGGNYCSNSLDGTITI